MSREVAVRASTLVSAMVADALRYSRKPWRSPGLDLFPRYHIARQPPRRFSTHPAPELARSPSHVRIIAQASQASPTPHPESQQPPLPPTPPPQHSHQHQHRNYHDIASNWHVRRTSLQDYPLATQQRILSRRRGGASAGSRAPRQQPPQPPARSPPGADGKLGEAAQQLLAAVQWEESTGCADGRGRSGERFSTWAAGRLRQLSAQLQPPPSSLPPHSPLHGAAAGASPAGTAVGEGGQTPDAGAACAQLAHELALYDMLDAAGRAQLLQRASLAAEAALQQGAALQQRYGWRAGSPLAEPLPALGAGATSAAEGPAAAAQHAERSINPAQTELAQAQAHWRAGGKSVSPAAPTGAAAAGSHPNLAAAGTAAQPISPAPHLVEHHPDAAAPRPPPSSPLQEGGELEAALQLAADPDAASAAAHEEESGNGSPEGEGLLAEGTVVASREVAAGLAVERERDSRLHAPGGDGCERGEDGEGERRGRKREVSPATAQFRRSFAEAAAAYEGAQGDAAVTSLSGGEQRSPQWFKLREKRLTASAFSKALGFFSGDREGLWEEKVGLRQPFGGNAATVWGNRSESRALEDYQRNTGQSVEGCMFHVKHDDVAHGWLGASPDGLIGGLEIGGGGGTGEASVGCTHHRPLSLWKGAGLVAGDGPGILEVKCPYNKGRPEGAVPPQHAIWYYMPQVQGLMDVFDREWCNLFIWTSRGGSGLYHIPRDRRYWGECYEVLAEFWWGHVVPARLARQRYEAEGGSTVAASDVARGQAPALQLYRPSAVASSTTHLKEWSKQLALEAPATFFPPAS